jgi:hypothetical protein
MGPFFGRDTPVVAPEGDLVFGGKPSRPLTLFDEEFTFVQPTGALGMQKT